MRLLKSLSKQNSVETFNAKSSANKLITVLRSIRTMRASLTGDQLDVHRFGLNLISVCKTVKTILQAEKRMIQIGSPAYVVGMWECGSVFCGKHICIVRIPPTGDIHGNFHGLMHFEKVLWNLTPEMSPCNLLFLGDYVDRGPNGVEVIAYLFSHKLLSPQKVFLIRGNHEIRDIQKAFTFYQ